MILAFINVLWPKYIFNVLLIESCLSCELAKGNIKEFSEIFFWQWNDIVYI